MDEDNTPQCNQDQRKRKRGRYKQYFKNSASAQVPRSTLRSWRIAEEARGNVNNSGATSSNATEESETLGTDQHSGGDIAGDNTVGVTNVSDDDSEAGVESNRDGGDHDGDCTSQPDSDEGGNSAFEARSESNETDGDEDEDENSTSEDMHENEEVQTDGKQQYYINKYNLNAKLHPNFSNSRLEVLLMILHLAIRHCHTEHFIEDCINFVNILFDCNVLDISYHIFKNVFLSSKSIERHYYCDDCDTYIGPQKDFTKDVKFSTCPKCGENINVQSVDSKNYFINLSVKEQIESLLRRPDVKLVSRQAERNVSLITDIFDGEMFKKCSEPGFPLEIDNILTVTFNTDGVQVYENSEKGSLWPILLHLNEIVPEHRFKTENVIVGGLWYGKAAPNMSLFLKPFINELLDLSQDGVSVLQPDGSIVMPVFAVACSVDSVAKAKVVCQRQFNGGHSCLYCYHPNDAVVDEGSAHHKHFDTTVTYPTRKEHEVIFDMTEADRLQQVGQLKSSVRGFLGISVLLMFTFLENIHKCNPFHIVWGVVIDYMHALLEGVASSLLILYRRMLTPVQIQILNRRLGQISLPQGISRKPRCVGDNVKYKAKEFRSFFLYFAVPCFEDLLPARHFSNLKLFVNALHVLLGDNIFKQELQKIRLDLQNFIRDFQQLFGLQSVTYNLHLCSHLVDLVLYMGPLWCYSNFIFESANGLIVRLVRGTRSASNEIAIKYTRLQSVLYV